MTETWDFLKSPAADAATNMAVDEVLVRTAAERGRPLLRVYSWLRPAVSIGYFQKFPAHLTGPPHLNPLPQTTAASRGLGSPRWGEEMSKPHFLAGQFDIVRRPTGGGLVYHGDGVDTTYTIVVPPTHALYKMKTADAYCAIHKAVAAAIGNRSQIANHQSPVPRTGYECFQNPVVGDVVADGKKLAGAAQRRTRWGLLHQGSIAARVTTGRLQTAFSASFQAEFQSFTLKPVEETAVPGLVRRRYATKSWNHRVG